jgi:glycerol-3-phosphate dehydrogenase
MPGKSGKTYDLIIIGAGINGAGIARDAAGRGLSVLVVEKDDIAAATSQWSTKLIHGGLRYLEYYEFRLVRESLSEREVVLRQAPHLVQPLQFVLPHEPHLRPAWMIRAGLFMYDHLSRRVTLPGSFGVDLASTRWGAGLDPRFRKGFVAFARSSWARSGRRACGARRWSTRTASAARLPAGRSPTSGGRGSK